MSKWIDRLEKVYEGNLFPHDKTDKRDKTPSEFSYQEISIGNIHDFQEAYEERAAIMEYDGGMSRQEAEHAAMEDCRVIYLKDREGR